MFYACTCISNVYVYIENGRLKESNQDACETHILEESGGNFCHICRIRGELHNKFGY